MATSCPRFFVDPKHSSQRTTLFPTIASAKNTLVLTNFWVIIKPRLFYFSSWGRGWKAKFQGFLNLSKRPVSLVSKNQNHELLPTSKKRHSRIWGWSVTFITCAERALNNINGCILNCYYKSEFYYKIKFLKKAE